MTEANGMVRRRTAARGLTTGNASSSRPGTAPVALLVERRAAPPGTRLREDFCLFGEAKQRR